MTNRQEITLQQVQKRGLVSDACISDLEKPASVIGLILNFMNEAPGYGPPREKDTHLNRQYRCDIEHLVRASSAFNETEADVLIYFVNTIAGKSNGLFEQAELVTSDHLPTPEFLSTIGLAENVDSALFADLFRNQSKNSPSTFIATGFKNRDYDFNAGNLALLEIGRAFGINTILACQGKLLLHSDIPGEPEVFPKDDESFLKLIKRCLKTHPRPTVEGSYKPPPSRRADS